MRGGRRSIVTHCLSRQSYLKALMFLYYLQRIDKLVKTFLFYLLKFITKYSQMLIIYKIDWKNCDYRWYHTNSPYQFALSILDEFDQRSKYHTNFPPLCLGAIFHEKAKNMILLYESTFFRRKFLKVSISH